MPDEWEGGEFSPDKGKYFIRQFSVMEHISIKKWQRARVQFKTKGIGKCKKNCQDYPEESLIILK